MDSTLNEKGIMYVGLKEAIQGVGIAEAEKIIEELKCPPAPPVTVCVGDEVQLIKPGLVRVYRITSPPDDGTAIRSTPSVGVWCKESGNSYAYIDNLLDMEGRPIERVVPFRIVKHSEGHGTWACLGVGDAARSYGCSLSTCKDYALAATKANWSWYEGPCCIIEN